VSDTKVVKKLFFAWQEDKELNWLSNMAKMGWELKHAAFCEYYFQKSQEKDIVFAFDYRAMNKSEFEIYISHFESFGWQYISSVANWHYFKAYRKDVVFPDIYSENTSKIEKYKRLMLTLIITLLPSLWAIILNLINYQNEKMPVFIFFVVFILSMDCFLFYGIYRIYRIIRRLVRGS